MLPNAIVKMIPSFSPFKRKIYWVIIKSTNSVRGRPGPIKRGLHSFQGFCHNALDLNILAQFTLCFLGIIFSATRIQIKWKKESEHALTSGITKRGLSSKTFLWFLPIIVAVSSGAMPKQWWFFYTSDHDVRTRYFAMKIVGSL